VKYCLYYWIVEPLRGGIRDEPTRTPSVSIDMTIAGRAYEIALLCDPAGVPDLLRCRIFGCTAEKLPADAPAALQELKEHLLSVLRLAYRSDLSLWPMTACGYFDEGKPYDVNLKMDLMGRGPEFVPATITGLFSATYPARHDIRLLVDSGDQRIPMVRS
jgi:hypothetical protein